MKKLILAIAAVALIASPALAVDWNFYGSARMATWYNTRDYNNGTPSDLDNGGYTVSNNFDSDSQVQWDLQGNSRFGATVKAENVSGRFELGLKQGSGGGDFDVGTRRIFGTWDFGAAKLKVGKDYTPVSQFVSGQAFAADAGLLGNGAAYGSRNGQLALSFGGFEIAAITNAGGKVRNLDTGDLDKYLPKMEAKWGMAFDTWNFTVMGGLQYFEIEDAGARKKNLNVTSWVIGGDAGVNFGPVYVKGCASYGANWGNAGWSGAVANASFNGDDDIKDMTSFQGAGILGFKFTDQLTFEGGFGYSYNDSDLKGEDNTDVWAGYVQAVVSMAPGVWVIPEVGYYNYGEDFNGNGKDWGTQFYAGAKWQIDF
ncbi:MAG: hypothetical protein P8185_18645 [Deltaproteobacteria bacterium]